MSNVHHCLLSACCKHSQICYVNGFAAHTKWLAPPMGRCSSRNFLSWAKPDHKVSQFFCVETSNVDKPCRQILYFSTLTCSLFAPPPLCFIVVIVPVFYAYISVGVLTAHCFVVALIWYVGATHSVPFSNAINKTTRINVQSTDP